MKVRAASEIRESGFYWVMNAREWIAAEWDSTIKRWTITGHWDSWEDDAFDEIDERRIERLTT